jgi:UMF1 family MFS transporter
LTLTLFGFVMNESPWLGLDRADLEHVRIAGPLCALWFVAFVWPLFVFTPDRSSNGLSASQAVAVGFKNLRRTFANLRDYKNIALFLVARMIYADGLATVFAMGGPYAAGVFSMELQEVIMFGILLNLTAGLGAAAFSWVDDAIGSRRTILIALTGLIVAATVAVTTTSEPIFWVAGAGIGVFVGPSQSASRSLMARISPRSMATEFFGLYALTGKATAFLGPLLVGALTSATSSQRFGMATVLGFFVVGGLLLLGVREERAEPVARA